MARRADVVLTIDHPNLFTGGTNYIVETPSGVLYMVYIDAATDVSFKKSSDGGLSWGTLTVVFAGTCDTLSVWYDRWSGIAAGLIHCAYTEDVGGDTLYRTINTESSDALSTQTTIFAGSSALTGGCHLSITRSRGGNVYCKTNIDNGTEGGFFRLPNANVPNGAWDAARTINEALASADQMWLAPGFAADNQDIIGIFIDASANELSRQLYDDSANTWSETTISGAGSFVEGSIAAGFPHVDLSVDLTNSRLIVVWWSAVDTANADLHCTTVTESAITETSTNVVLNSTDDQGLCAISIDAATAARWTVFYGGKSDGSETWGTSINIYSKTSTDGGATWGAETQETPSVSDIMWMATVPWRYQWPPMVAYHRDIPATTVEELSIVVDRVTPHATYVAGLV